MPTSRVVHCLLVLLEEDFTMGFQRYKTLKMRNNLKSKDNYITVHIGDITRSHFALLPAHEQMQHREDKWQKFLDTYILSVVIHG